MTLKRYLSTLVSPISPRRPRTSTESTSIDSPVSVRSPIEDLRDFWKKTFDESLERGEEFREAALARIRAQREYLSAAEVWDLQTMNDGYVPLHAAPQWLLPDLHSTQACGRARQPVRLCSEPREAELRYCFKSIPV